MSEASQLTADNSVLEMKYFIPLEKPRAFFVYLPQPAKEVRIWETTFLRKMFMGK